MSILRLPEKGRIDIINIGLMLVACVVAIFIPFELFLFSYAVLGPLHYLTEISWLHDRNYFVNGKFNPLIFIIISLLITIAFFNDNYALGLDLPEGSIVKLLYIAFLSALVFVLIKNNIARLIAVLFFIITSKISDGFVLFFIFLPTLIHVYFFTGLFMLFGALKNKSLWGIVSVCALVIFPVLLFIVFPNTGFYGPSSYSEGAYGLFRPTNIISLNKFLGVPKQLNDIAWDKMIFHSQTGILLMRCIAFAYTYHYLNWFSKTEVIRWHKMPKKRLFTVIVIWLVSIGLYMKNYALGLHWLLFLSTLHVLLELPLNYVSVIGIGKHVQGIFVKRKANLPDAKT